MQNTSSHSEHQNPVNNTLGIYYEHKESQSFKSLMIKLILKLMNRKSGSHMIKKITTGINENDIPDPPEEIKTEFKVSSWEVNGKNIFRLCPKENKSNKVILYLHGGAYVNNTTKYHWDFILKLLKELQCTIIFPDYPLAPNNTYLETYDVVESVYKKILLETDPKDIVFMGDSAGGGLALGLAQKMKNENIPQPKEIILLAPWLDITLSNPEILELDKDDPMLGIEPCKMAGKAYVGEGDPNHYMLSPINGVIEGLGRLSIFIGTHDLLYADTKKFKSRCEQEGVALNYFVYPKMVHVWMIIGLTESQVVIKQIKDLIQ